jgi:hypothetical protein
MPSWGGSGLSPFYLLSPLFFPSNDLSYIGNVIQVSLIYLLIFEVRKSPLYTAPFRPTTSHNHNIMETNNEKITININETIIFASPTNSPTIENIDAAEETHQFDADAALLLCITLICCTMLVSCNLKFNVYISWLVLSVSYKHQSY